MGRAVVADQVRELRLDRAIAAHQRVVFGIRDLGGVVAVIQRVMARDLGSQSFKFGGGLGFSHGAAHGHASFARA